MLKRINSKGGIIPDVILVGDILESLSLMINNPHIESEVVSKTEELGVTIVNFIIGHWKALDKCIFAIFPALAFSLTTFLTKNDSPIENELLYKLLELTRHGKVGESLNILKKLLENSVNSSKFRVRYVDAYCFYTFSFVEKLANRFLEKCFEDDLL